MRISKSTAFTVGSVLVAVVLLYLLFAQGSTTVVEKPVYINPYVYPDTVFVQPAWWGYFGYPWGYKTGYDKPWKMGSGLPGMKVPPPPPPAPAGPSQPALPPAPPPAPAPAPPPSP